MARGRVVGESERRTVGPRRKVWALGMDFVTVFREFEFAQDRRWHQADHIGQRGHFEVGTPGLFRDGGAAYLVATFEHGDLGAAFGQQSGGDETVVAPADHDDVERIVGHAARVAGRWSAQECDEAGDAPTRERELEGGAVGELDGHHAERGRNPQPFTAGRAPRPIDAHATDWDPHALARPGDASPEQYLHFWSGVTRSEHWAEAKYLTMGHA